MSNETLERFIEAQDGSYEQALREIKGGRKESHWMWYIFPQLRGLGRSDMAYRYGITGREEAVRYLAHPVLGARFIEITEALLALEGSDPVCIFGQTDALKLRSSLTLFAAVSAPGSLFHAALDRYYGGAHDRKTLQMLEK